MDNKTDNRTDSKTDNNMDNKTDNRNYNKKIFDRINELLEDTDYPVKITSVADIDDFLLDDDNRRFEQFPVIGRLYDNLRGKPEIDRYSDVSIPKEAEQIKLSKD